MKVTLSTQGLSSKPSTHASRFLWAVADHEIEIVLALINGWVLVGVGFRRETDRVLGAQGPNLPFFMVNKNTISISDCAKIHSRVIETIIDTMLAAECNEPDMHMLGKRGDEVIDFLVISANNNNVLDFVQLFRWEREWLKNEFNAIFWENSTMRSEDRFVSVGWVHHWNGDDIIITTLI